MKTESIVLKKNWRKYFLIDNLACYMLIGVHVTCNPTKQRKIEKNKINKQFNSEYKIRENLCPKISFRTSKPSLG